MPESYTCVYCLETKEESEFNKDHVMPKCFGTFEQGMTLINKVCASCNKYLGDNIELNLGRDSLEGVTRYNYEIFPHGKPTYRRLIFKIDKLGPLYGTLVSPKPQILEGLPEIELIDQVGFFNTKTGRYEYFPSSYLPEKEELEKVGFDIKNKEITFIGDIDESQQVLGIMGYSAQFLREEQLFKTPEDRKRIPVNITARIDRTVARGMAKIAFNYLAHIAPSNFVLGSGFNKIRNFIRHDVGDFDELFQINKIPILKKERERRKRVADGHILVVNWDEYDLVGSLSIFNRILQMTYVINLSKRHPGVWIPISSGHYFDVFQHTIRTIYSIERLVLP
jgi:hypothetical protein